MPRRNQSFGHSVVAVGAVSGINALLRGLASGRGTYWRHTSSCVDCLQQIAKILFDHALHIRQRQLLGQRDNKECRMPITGVESPAINVCI
jgi:hypothetical protein